MQAEAALQLAPSENTAGVYAIMSHVESQAHAYKRKKKKSCCTVMSCQARRKKEGSCFMFLPQKCKLLRKPKTNMNVTIAYIQIVELRC